jgi:hypothetical protein
MSIMFGLFSRKVQQIDIYSLCFFEPSGCFYFGSPFEILFPRGGLEGSRFRLVPSACCVGSVILMSCTLYAILICFVHFLMSF